MITGLILSGVVGLALQLPPPAAEAGPPGRGDKADAPFSRLFDPSQQPKATPPKIPKFQGPAEPRGPSRKIVCGTTLIIVGQPVDQNMVKPVPESDTRYTMRRVPPPACGKDKK